MKTALRLKGRFYSRRPDDSAGVRQYGHFALGGAGAKLRPQALQTIWNGPSRRDTFGAASSSCPGSSIDPAVCSNEAPSKSALLAAAAAPALLPAASARIFSSMTSAIIVNNVTAQMKNPRRSAFIMSPPSQP